MVSRPCRISLAFFLASLALVGAFASGATGAPMLSPRGAAATPGAIKLAKSDLKKVGAVQCGRKAGVWRAGTLVKAGASRGWFLSWSKTAANSRAEAAKAKGAKRTTLLKAAAAAVGKDRLQTPKCRATSAAAAASASSGAVPLYAPLRLSFGGTAGVIRYERSRRGPTRRPRQAGLTNLDALLRNGSLRNPVVSGSIVASYVAVGPDGDLYFAANGVLGVPLPDGTFPSMCIIVRYHFADDSTTCVPTGTTDYFGVWTSPETGAPLQIGPNGEVYYLMSRSTIVLMRSYNGNVTTMTNPNLNVNGFAVASNGAVLITGRTPSSNAEWTRIIHPDGSLSSLASSQARSLETYPDGRIYWGDMNTAHVYDPTSDTDALWAGGYAGYKMSATTTDGKVFVLGSQSGSSATFARNYPTPGLAAKGGIDAVTAISPAGPRVAITGTQLSGRSRLGLHDPTTNTTTLIDGALPEFEYYTLSYSPTRNVVIFDALRFQDNAYLIGEIDLTTDAISIISTTSTRLSGLTGY